MTAVMNKRDAFERGTADYEDWAETPWGRLRTEMLWRQLQWHLPRPGLEVLDAGCGLGQLAIRLAQAGHVVTACDFSAGMLRAAQERALKAGAAVEWRQMPVEETAAAFPPASFDLALCHSVLSYVPHPAAVAHDLAALLKPDGLLSLVGSNPQAQALHTAVWRHDFEAALAQLERPTRYSGAFDLDLELHDIETMTAWIQTAGLKVIACYGVRTVNDLITDNAIKYDPPSFAALLELEMALCNKSPYRDIAAYSHLLARPA